MPDDNAENTILPTREGYDVWSKIYDDEDNPLITLEDRMIHDLLGDVRGRTIADVGCGTGRHAIRMAKAGARVTALDFSERMLEKAYGKPGSEDVRFTKHDLARPFPLDTSEFDVVTCCLVVDHIADLDGLFRELGRICNANGFILISVMHPAMMLRGVQARFTDPASGQVTCPDSQPHQICDYVMAAVGAGLLIDHMSEHSVDDCLVDNSRRAARYMGWPLLLLMRLTRSSP
ncbi:MAG: class I SAM-dependent methyltransferase [Planctomycetota bacterium]|jgi:malonyl-CoA O-methyltransferase